MIPTPAPAATPTATPPAAFRVQLGAFRIAENAPALWRRLSMTQPDLLGGLRQRIQRADRGERVFHLLQVGPLADTEAATALCAALTARGRRLPGGEAMRVRRASQGSVDVGWFDNQ